LKVISLLDFSRVVLEFSAPLLQLSESLIQGGLTSFRGSIKHYDSSWGVKRVARRGLYD